MESLNKVTLMGCVGKEPEIHYFDKKLACVRFSLATDETYLNKDQQNVKVTQWHQIVMWRQVAQNAENQIHKGNWIYIEGKITYQTWTDKQSQVHHQAQINASHFIVLDKAHPKERLQVVRAEFSTQIQEHDDLPF